MSTNRAPIFNASEAHLVSSAFLIANRAVVADIESNCIRVGAWYDTRPMIDPREHAAEALDMAAELLRYGEAAGVIKRHPRQRYMVRIEWTDTTQEARA
jgi:hypothetical protein